MTTENSTPRSYPEFNDMTFDQLRLVLDGAADRAMQVVKSIDLFWEKFPNEMQPLLKDWKEHCQIIGYSTDSTASDGDADLTEVWGVAGA
jgi:hypothetical protein